MGNSLFEAAKDILRDIFAGYHHFPTNDQQEGLDDVLLHLSKMAEGQLENKYFVSSLDPGVGKTKAVTSFLKALSASESHQNVGALVGVSTKNEIEAIIEGLKSLDVPKTSYAVLVSDYKNLNAELRALGSGDPSTSQILLTTQQMIAQRCIESPLERANAFHFKNSVRPVRIWDESFLPANPVSLSFDQIAASFEDLSRNYPEERKQMVGFNNQLQASKDGDVIDVFSSLGETGESGLSTIASLMAILRGRNSLSAKTIETLRSLVSMKYQSPVVRLYQNIPYLVGFADTLPSDLSPLVILDASARIRHTYELWDKHRGNLVFLKNAVKDYSKLKIHWWNKGGGKSTFKVDADRYAVAISDAINSAPQDQWLVIHHNSASLNDINMEELIGEAMNHDATNPKPNVSYLTWGNHTATNAFKDVKHIILAGTLFYPQMAYEAHANAASDKTSSGPIDEDLITKTQVGESLHGILQAACRGSVRNINEGSSDTCDVFLIVDGRRGIVEELPRVFPNCEIIEWVPEPPTPSGRALDALKCIQSHFERSPDVVYRFSDLKTHLQMKSQQLTALRKRLVLRSALNDLGIVEDGPGIRSNCYRMMPRESEVTPSI
jgi:hypothetical protein